MRKLLFVILILTRFDGAAQSNLQVQFGYRGSVAAAKFLPSTHSLDSVRFEGSLEYSLWVANKSLTYGSIRSIFFENRITEEDINGFISEMDEENRLGGGQNFLVFGFGFQHKLRGGPLSWSFTISDRFTVNAAYPKTLAQLMWQGNRQFQGQTLNLSPTAVTGLYFREFSLGAARTLVTWPNWSFRAGARLNYYMGLSGVSNAGSSFFFKTEVQADFLELDYDFNYFHTGVEDFDLLDPRGHGFGGDLGVTFSHKDKLNFDFGLTDMGSIKFKKNINQLSSQATVLFSGFDREDLDDTDAFLDSLIGIFTPAETPASSFKMPIGVKFSFMTSWKFGETTKRHGAKTLHLFYRQGFSENPEVTRSPKVALAIHRPMFRILHLGLSASVGGFNNWGVGGLLGLELKHFRFGVHSDDFTWLFFPDETTAASAGFILQVLI